MLQRCDQCSAYRFPLWERCDQCWSTNWAWVESSGRGTLYTFGRMHRVYHPGFEPRVPYTIAVVELDEGPRVETRLIHPSDETPHCGMPVSVVFQSFSNPSSDPTSGTSQETVSVPFFAPA